VGEEGGGFALTTASFTGAAALVGILGVALMRAAFDFVLHFARTERRGGLHPIIEHQAVGFALADAKTIIEAMPSTRCHPPLVNLRSKPRSSGRRWQSA
jgi:nitroalkane oxidase